MCRNIKALHNFKPAATDEEIRASSLQFVRKLSGFTRPSKVNEYAFTRGGRRRDAGRAGTAQFPGDKYSAARSRSGSAESSRAIRKKIQLAFCPGYSRA